MAPALSPRIPHAITLAPLPGSPNVPKIHYTLSMPEPQTHLYQVRMDVEGLAGSHVDLVMPVWTPGAYAVRDFARHVQDFEAGPIAWTKVEKSRWRVRTRGSSKLHVTYRV